MNGNGIGKDEVEESSRKVLQVHEALRQHPLLILTRPAKFHSPTFEIPAAPEVELLDLLALEHINVAWGSGGAEKE